MRSAAGSRIGAERLVRPKDVRSSGHRSENETLTSRIRAAGEVQRTNVKTSQALFFSALLEKTPVHGRRQAR
jgi:hypothetical protein